MQASGKKTTHQRIARKMKFIIENSQNTTSLNPNIRAFCLISTPRVGSSMLCEKLRNTHLFGYPSEWFNPTYVQEYVKLSQKPFSFDHYLAQLLQATTTPNGIFCVNFHVNQYMFWKSKDIDLLNLGFEKIYWIERKDKIKQAYSYAKASIHNVWSKATEIESKLDASQYKPISLSNMSLYLHRICEQIDVFEAEIQPHTHRSFFYEDFIQTQASEVVETISRDFQIQIPAEELAQVKTLKKQSTSKDYHLIAHMKKRIYGEAH